MEFKGSQAVQEGLKEFMRLYPQGVTIVTTKVGDKIYGMTVSSFTSVSLNPPLVTIAIDRASNSYSVFRDAQTYIIHILSSEQVELSERFAGRLGVTDRFAGISWREGLGGVPILDDAPAYIVCRKYGTVEAGDHTLVLCEVLETVINNPNFKPLVYRARAYTTLAS
ncbi:MAG: flavin reductase family protein [Nitrososphaerota archaeon]